jgi:hypothetical protein
MTEPPDNVFPEAEAVPEAETVLREITAVQNSLIKRKKRLLEGSLFFSSEYL